jgi:hypothetical protein
VSSTVKRQPLERNTVLSSPHFDSKMSPSAPKAVAALIVSTLLLGCGPAVEQAPVKTTSSQSAIVADCDCSDPLSDCYDASCGGDSSGGGGESGGGSSSGGGGVGASCQSDADCASACAPPIIGLCDSAFGCYCPSVNCGPSDWIRTYTTMGLVPTPSGCLTCPPDCASTNSCNSLPPCMTVRLSCCYPT